jgi:hypothetical protein
LALFLGRREFNLRLFYMVDEKSLEITDGDRTILFNPLTFPLAGMRAGIGENSGKRKGLSHKSKGLLKLPLGDESHIALSITVKGAGSRTGGSPPAIHRIFKWNCLGEGDIDRFPIS